MNILDKIRNKFIYHNVDVSDKNINKVIEKITKGDTLEKATSRVIKNEQQRKRRQKNKNNFLDYGIDEKFISQYDLTNKNIKKMDKSFLKKLKKKSTALKLERKKEKALKDKGISFKKSDLRKSWEKLRQENNLDDTDTFYSLRYYLYVGFSDVLGLGFDPHVFDNFSVITLEKSIREFILEAILFPDNSDDFVGVWVYDYGYKSDMEYKAKVYSERGYNFSRGFIKLDGRNYRKLTVSNSWSKKEFLKMFATVLYHMKSSDRLEFREFLLSYANACKIDYLKKI